MGRNRACTERGAMTPEEQALAAPLPRPVSEERLAEIRDKVATQRAGTMVGVDGVLLVDLPPEEAGPVAAIDAHDWSRAECYARAYAQAREDQSKALELLRPLLVHSLTCGFPDRFTISVYDSDLRAVDVPWLALGTLRSAARALEGGE